MKKETLHSLRNRRSIREYAPQQINDAELNHILELGTYAPSARGGQSPLIVAVQNKKLLAEASELNRKIMAVEFDPYHKAPTVVFVFGNTEFPTYKEDAACVLMQMMLAAYAYGIGSCWVNREREMFETEEGKGWMREWGVPEAFAGVGALALGYPSTEPTEAKPRKEGYIIKIK